jgi:hypothetical protein
MVVNKGIAAIVAGFGFWFCVSKIFYLYDFLETP